MDSVFVVWGGTEDYGWWESVVGSSLCPPPSHSLLYSHLSPSSLRFRLGTAVIFKTYKHHLLLSRAYCRGQYFA